MLSGMNDFHIHPSQAIDDWLRLDYLRSRAYHQRNFLHNFLSCVIAKNQSSCEPFFIKIGGKRTFF